ncbi:MAG: ABC transporter permease [Campylobacteraceae bacterium]
MNREFFALFKKECLIVLKDRNALLALFLLPIVFILIMSYALKDVTNSSTNLTCNYFIDEKNDSDYMAKFQKSIDENTAFTCKRIYKKQDGQNADLLAIIPENFFIEFVDNSSSSLSISLLYKPSLNIASVSLFESMIKEKIVLLFALDGDEDFTPIFVKNMQKEFLVKTSFGNKVPNSVEQSVPSWLVFAMFFILMPLSTVFIIEKEQGTLRRLRSLRVSPLLFFGAKTLTYNIINMLQGVVMLFVGLYIVKLFGLEPLRIENFFAMFALLYSISIAAIGFALLVATLAKSSSEAIIVGGLGNVLLGAIGGIMVPKYVMPDIMQTISLISPMSWGLDGFLEIVLNEGSLLSVLPSICFLMLFGMILFLMSLIILIKQKGE